MRTTITVIHPDKVIDLTFSSQGQDKWTLSKEDLLYPPSQVETTAFSTDATDTAIPLVEPEWKWIQENEDTLRENYAGRWIAVLFNRVVTVGDSEIDVLRGAEELGYENPFTFYVPTQAEPAVMANYR
jgi:hypothetical protein